MATKQTAKKAPVKKTTATSASAKAKKTTASRASTAKAKKSAQMKSFKVYKSETPFTTLKPTKQTFYWIVILGLITIAQLLILKIQIDIIELTQPLL